MNQFKTRLIILLALVCIQCNTKQEQLKTSPDTTNITTTYFLIRHAEKDTTDQKNRDPKLTEKGTKRAKEWSHILSNTSIDIVFSTKYNRTIETATPIAKLNNISIDYYDPNQLYTKKFQQQTTGKTCVIIGHSNTTPAFVNKIIGQDKYQNIHHNDYGKVYIVTINNNTITDTSLSIN